MLQNEHHAGLQEWITHHVVVAETIAALFGVSLVCWLG